MNERIKELAIECAGQKEWDFPKDPKSYTFTPDELAKFAELIVRECALLCESRLGPGDDVRSRQHCSEQILEHFGVKL
jgi:hypothetical protein